MSQQVPKGEEKLSVETNHTNIYISRDKNKNNVLEGCGE